MDKMIFTSLNSIQNLYDQRFNISQNLANISVPGYRRDLGNDAGSAFLEQYNQLGPRAYNLESGPGQFSNEPGAIKLSDVKTDVAVINKSFMLALNEKDEVIFTRRGDLQVSPDGILTNGSGERILSENLEPIELPAFNDIKVAPYGELLRCRPVLFLQHVLNEYRLAIVCCREPVLARGIRGHEFMQALTASFSVWSVRSAMF